MKRKMISGVLGLSMLAIAGVATAQEGPTPEVSLTADFASSYVFRGVTLNDGWVLQPGLEIGGLPITIGVWGNLDLDDYSGTLESGEFSEIDIYFGYSLPIESDVHKVDIGLTEYTYPMGGEADSEVALSYSAAVITSPEIAAYYGMRGGIEQSFYLEGTIGHEAEIYEDITGAIGATIGYLVPDEGKDGFSSWTASASATWKAVTIDLTYIGQIDDEVLPDTAPVLDDTGNVVGYDVGYDVEFVGTVGLAYAF